MCPVFQRCKNHRVCSHRTYFDIYVTFGWHAAQPSADDLLVWIWIVHKATCIEKRILQGSQVYRAACPKQSSLCCDLGNQPGSVATHTNSQSTRFLLLKCANIVSMTDAQWASTVDQVTCNKQWPYKVTVTMNSKGWLEVPSGLCYVLRDCCYFVLSFTMQANTHAGVIHSIYPPKLVM